MEDSAELAMGTKIVVNDLKYKCKGIKKEMTGFIVKPVDTYNRHDWKRYKIFFPEIQDCRNLYDSEFKIVEFENVFEKFDSVKTFLDYLLKENLKGEYDMSELCVENNEIGVKVPALKIWTKNMEEKINKYFDKKKVEILSEDILNNEIDSFKEDFLELLDDNGYGNKNIKISVSVEDIHTGVSAYMSENEIYTEDTRLDLKENNESRERSLGNLHNYCKEIHSMLAICQDFDSITRVLRDYKVIENVSLKVNNDFHFEDFIEVVFDVKD